LDRLALTDQWEIECLAAGGCGEVDCGGVGASVGVDASVGAGTNSDMTAGKAVDMIVEMRLYSCSGAGAERAICADVGVDASVGVNVIKNSMLQTVARVYA